MTPEQLTVEIERLFSDLEIRIMSDIVRRIRINGFSTASADWQITRLQQLGRSEEEIKKWIQAALGAADEELEHIFSDQVYEQYMGHERAYKVNGFEQIPYDSNMPLQQLAEAAKSQISKEYQNMADSMGFALRDHSGKVINTPLLEFYRNTLDNAVLDIQSGAFSYQVVLERTINRMTASGLRRIEYDSGHSNRVDVAARRAVLTGFRQVQGQINEQVARDLGTDSYEVTWHRGARPSHQVWQGRVYTMEQLKTICGLGTVTGLCGANCYHNYSAFIPGVSVRTYTDEWLDQQNALENTPREYLGKEYTTYEALQQQRKLETRMRKYREDIKLLQEGEGDPDSIILKKARYRGTMREYEAFSDAMDLPVQKERIYQDGLGRVAAGRLPEKGKKTGKSVEKQDKTGIMRLPDYEKAVISREKFTHYALEPARDPNKARAFKEALGYTKENADELILKIYEQLPKCKAFEKGDKGYGMTYQVDMKIEGPNGKAAKVLTGWIRDKQSGKMRLITVHVDK